MDPFDLRAWPLFEAAGGNPSLPAVIDQIVIDSRRVDSANALFIALEGAQTDGHCFVSKAAQKGALYAIVRNGWHPCEPLPVLNLLRVEDPAKALQEIAKIYRGSMKCHVIAIAGSYGKTMVKDLLEALIGTTHHTAASPESFNSQIGVPLSLFKISSKHEVAIIEAGISQPQEMERLAAMIQPHSVILTPIGNKHLATLGSKETILKETFKLLHKKMPGGWVLAPQEAVKAVAFNDPIHLWNAPDPELPHACFMAHAKSGSTLPYEVTFPSGEVFQGLASSGFYYFPDLLNMTLKAAWLMGIPAQKICGVLKNYAVEPSRIEIWKSPLNVLFFNDTYCSDPQSIDQSLRRLEQVEKKKRKIFIFGGLRESESHQPTDYKRIGEALSRAGIDILYLHGNHQFDALIAEVKKNSPRTPIHRHSTYQEALDAFKERMEQDDLVLIKGAKKEPFEALTQTFHDSVCTNQCIINLAAIHANLLMIRNKLPSNNRIMVMVKALAYGTDDVRIGKFLESCGIDILGVSYVDEAVSLRRAGIAQAIFVINAAPYELAKIIKWNLEVGVSEEKFICELAEEAEAQGKVVKVHLHVDTGMSRFGCRLQEAEELAMLIQRHRSLKLEGIMTHFACADDPKEDSFTLAQAKFFEDIIQKIEARGIQIPWKHAANSSGAIRFRFDAFNMARVGLAVYGLHASQETREAIELRLAVSLVSRIVGINFCKAGETISYGRKYTVSREVQKIAVLPIGYFDGLHRNYSGKAYVMIRGYKAPMVGTICMDFMMVDVTDIPHVAIGDPVLIFGEDEYGYFLPPEELAQKGDSIIHELMTCLGPRIQRIFVHEEARPNNRVNILFSGERTKSR